MSDKYFACFVWNPQREICNSQNRFVGLDCKGERHGWYPTLRHRHGSLFKQIF